MLILGRRLDIPLNRHLTAQIRVHVERVIKAASLPVAQDLHQLAVGVSVDLVIYVAAPGFMSGADAFWGRLGRLATLEDVQTILVAVRMRGLVHFRAFLLLKFAAFV